jgi:superfamily II DNA or RNA helicase
MEVTYLNSIFSKAENSQTINFLRKYLLYEYKFYLLDRFNRRREKTGIKYMVHKTTGIFYSGFIPRIMQLNKDIKINNYTFSKYQTVIPNLQLREYQQDLCEKAIKLGRGVIVAPTGSGKTLIAHSLIESFPNTRIIYLVPFTDLLNQTFKYFSNYYENVGIINSRLKEEHNFLTIGMLQSFKNFLPELQCSYDMIIVDECHEGIGWGTSMAKILTTLDIPLRFGFTATLPRSDNPEGAWSLEGLIGSVIQGEEFNSLAEKGFLVKPKVVLVPYATSHFLSTLKYKEAYEQSIVKNIERNKKIVDKANEMVQNNHRVLIFVNRLEHGEILSKMLPAAIFINGSDEAVVREKVRNHLITGKRNLVIATVFKQGVDIPSLDCIINAAGGKSEIELLQTIGRTSRIAEGKETAYIIDFIDKDNRFIAQHFATRLNFYHERGWL